MRNTFRTLYGKSKKIIQFVLFLLLLVKLTNPVRVNRSQSDKTRVSTNSEHISNFYLPLLSNRVDISRALCLRMLSSAGWVAGLQLATCPGPAAAPATTESVTGAWHNTSLTLQ